MKCPYCGGEMFEGYLYNGSQPIQWMRKGAMPARIAFTKTDQGVTLKNRFSLFKESGYCAQAFYCDPCHVVIAPTGDAQP